MVIESFIKASPLLSSEKKEMEEKSAIARERELSDARKEIEKVKIIRRESHGDVESEEENEDEVDDEDKEEDGEGYNDPLDAFELDNEEEDDEQNIITKNERLQKMRHHKADKNSSTIMTGRDEEYSPIHKLHDYSEPPVEG